MATIIRRRKLGMSSVRYICMFSKSKIKWIRSDKKLLPDDVYIRWGCTANVPSKTIINTAKAIHEVNDKRGFRAVLDGADLCPPTWFNTLDVPDEFLELGVVVRPARHAQGRNIFLCKTRKSLTQAVIKCGEGYYISQFIDKVEEYRVFVIQGRAAWVAKKNPGNPDDLAWNVAKGGCFYNVRWGDWPLKAVRIAIEAYNESSLHFGGVDVMVDRVGNVYVLEINSAPSLTSPYRQECTAKTLDWLLENGADRIPLVERKGKYLKFIHPALDSKAFIVGEE